MYTQQSLEALKAKELSIIFIKEGGISSDSRRPKAWLIERILWMTEGAMEAHRRIRDGLLG